MYCKRCNVDFGEGLRYCKWCGDTLEERERITSELYTCPACSSQVRKGWIFCKSCGARLDVSSDKPAPVVTPPEHIESGGCWSCGEALEPNSLYCKSCGSAVYEGPTIAEQPGLLCSGCKSVSPVGSINCRVCGAPLTAALGATPASSVQSETIPKPASPPGSPAAGPEPDSRTLPDLGEHLAKMRRAPTRDDVATPVSEIDSGAHTFFLSGEGDPRPAGPDEDSISPETMVLEPGQQDGQRGPRDTTMMPGAVNETGQGSSTTTLKQTRITAPVEGEKTVPVRRDDWFHSTSPIAADNTSAVPPPAADSPGQATVALGTDPSNGSAQPPTQTIDFVAVSPPAQQPQTVPPPVGVGQPAAHTRVDTPAPTAPGAVPQWDQPPARPHQPPADKKNVVKIISALVAVAVIGAAVFGLWWYAVGGNKPRQAPAKVETPVTQPSVPPQPTGPPPPPEGMVRVDGGTVTIGRNAGDPLEQPAHSAVVEAFYIDRTEVTNAQYKKFLDATGHPPPPPTRESRWVGTNFPPGEDKMPVVWVTWQDATAYAEWLGKRLPTEVEWEAAARGADARIYPWGNKWKPGAANIGINTGKPADVGSYTDSASPSGALDMVGNVWEWTADEMSVYTGSKGVIETEPGVTYRVIRGGAFDGSERHSASYRGYQDASKPYPRIGFRCAKSAK